MKTYRFILVPLLLLILLNPLKSQETAYYSNISREIDVAKELFNKGKFISAYHEFQKIGKSLDKNSERYAEAEFYKSLSALKAGYKAGNKMLENFIENQGESPYINEAWFAMADYQFERKQYPAVLRSLRQVNRSDLAPDKKIKFGYMNGYSNMVTDNLDAAAREFFDIKDANNMFSKPATYYWAHIMYLEGKYQSALDGFKSLNNDPVYSKVIPLYVSHIYYKQQRYNEIIKYTPTILDYMGKEEQVELSKIVGDSYFHVKEFKKAISYFERYFDATPLKTREDNYILGYCYYQSGQFAKAKPLLENASKGEDAMAQNAYYHLADCYLKAGDKEKAKLAFDAASKMDFDEKIKEDALFSYAKLTYELSYSPFNETIKAFDNYINLYPYSERNPEAYQILTEVYMVTRNYKDAIASIEKIKNKTPSILQAFQRVTFYRGLELFNNLSYNQAIENFDLSLENSSYDKQISARALFWKGEALYRVGDYSSSINTFTRFLLTTGASSAPEYNDAEYNLAYAYFKNNNYESAASHFRKYVTANQNYRSEKLADAYNRIGDFYFLKTNYKKAIQNYQQAYSLNTFEPDYALYRIAFSQGLLRNESDKMANLEKLLKQYPESDYEDDAIYELARAYERTGENLKAIKAYKGILENYPQSIYYPKSLLQIGLIHYNNGNYEKALTRYKEVAEKYHGTSEAQTALSGIKNCYVELNRIDDYFIYVRKLGSGNNVSVTEQDSLTFMAAERAYMAGNNNATTQLQRYLQQFPNGSFAINAHFYLGELLYKQGNYNDANKHYAFVVDQPNNIFTEQALSRASELKFNAEDYTAALTLFNRLEAFASGKWNVLKANTGQMRCNLILKQYQQAIISADKVAHSEIANEALRREANFIMGKSYYLTDNLTRALSALKPVAENVTLEQGAEAKYRVAEIYFKQGNKQQAENEIMNFISQNTPYQYWLGKAFILLADIYLDKGDEFQAKHTLKSLVENYNNPADGIIKEASQKLDTIEAREKEAQQKAVDGSYQIRIDEN
ncbi:MAG: hypothetical protein CSA36_02385 [Draconibacterium sp.]|nr:MAG: hypothetical protein CSA36_02385 [Draconibacterium sp.]